MHLIQNESRYSIEFRKSHFYRILYLNQYIFYIHGQHTRTCIPKHFRVLAKGIFDQKCPK